MRPGLRLAIALAGAAGVLALVLAAVTGLPPFGDYPGPYGTVLNTVAVHERKIPNVITAVNFDYRGLDTLGEEFILFAAVAGLALVLRHDRAKITEEALPVAAGRRHAGRSDAVRAFSLLGIALTVAFGTYMAIHPHLTPGGGFQGGTILSGFVALAFLGLGYPTFTRLVDQEPSELLESLGAGAYGLIGIATLFAGGAFLANVLPLGGEGTFFSTGTIPVINAFVALEVCTGFILMFLEFARETRHEEPRKE
jgi:multicomponent Na+:H+ antiporter subunit B